MKLRKIKTRAVALGLAMLMGISPLGSASYAYAAEENEGLQLETAAVETQTEESEATVQSEQPLVTAEDITKSVSDTEFAVETSMEGITFDAEKESVTLTGIESEDGKNYQPDKAGTYIATYLVVPKDQRDSYHITRKIILTETEGEAHTESNGGENQKEDTESEDDSENGTETATETELSQTPTEVNVTGSEEDTEASLQKLEEDIATGDVMILSGADVMTARATTVNLDKGETIYYPSYIGNYLTCRFTVNGKLAYCLQSQKASPPDGDYVANVLDSNKNLQKVLYYGYGGAGDVTGSYLSGKSGDEKYVYTHIAASYAYAGEAGFTGCDYNDLVNAGVIAYIDYLFGMEEPPKGEISLSNTSVKAVRDGDTQKTSDIKLSGDGRNYITITVPANVTCYNKIKGTSKSNGDIRIYGGDTFYLTAPMSVTGSFASGTLKGSVRESWRTLVLTTGDASQDIGVFESETAEPVSFEVDWLEMTRIQLVKKDAKTANPLNGAVYGIYTDKACKNLLMQMSSTAADGKTISDYFEASVKTAYVKELTAPINYVKNDTVYTVDVTAGKTVEVTGTDEYVKGSVHIEKIDCETQQFVPQGDSELAGAVYGLYAAEEIHHPDKSTGLLYKKDSLIAQGTIGADGTLDFTDLFLGKMYVKEITPPKGYTLDTTRYDVTLSYEGQEKKEVTRDLTVTETVKKQAFQLIKISEDGSQTETDLIKGAGFSVYLVSSLSKVKSGELKPSNGSTFTAKDFTAYDFSKEQVAVTYENGKAVAVPELITDAKGYAISVEIPYGDYVVVESTVPENLKPVNPFIVKISEDSREPQQWRVFDDRPFEFLLKIIKKDAHTGNTVLKAGASYKIYDCIKEAYVEQVIQYPKHEKLSVFTTNEEGYLVTPEELKCSTYRIEEVKAPEGFVRQGYEMSLFDGEEIISGISVTERGSYKETPKNSIEITVTDDTAHQIDPDTGAVIVEVEQPNDEQVGSLTLEKTGEQLVEVTGDSLLDKVGTVLKNIKEAVTGEESESGILRDFVYEETGVEGAEFELHAKETIYAPDGAVDKEGNPVIRYHKDDLVRTLVTDAEGKAVVNNLPLGSYYMKETVAGEHFVLNTEQKEFTLTAEDDTQAVVYEGVAYKNERQKVEVSLSKKDAVSGEALEGVVFGLYAAEDILSNQGEVMVEKDTLLEKKATDADGKVAFDSDLFHGKYYVKEEQRLPGYLPNEEIWEFEADYEDQNTAVLTFTKEVENQPTESQFTKVDLTTGEELEGATLQILDKDGTVVEEWTSTKEAHVVYGLPEGSYTLHEELAPLEDGYVSAEDIEFEVLEDGTVTEVEMKDGYSKTEISKTDITTGEELEGAKLQILDKDGTVLEEWVTDGKPHSVEKLPVGVELTLREITAPDGYEIAEDVKFTLEDTREVQKVEMKDARTPETSVPKTGDNPLKPILLVILCGICVAGLVLTIRKKKKYHKTNERK
ncbi:SpaA isopeptide-forming pilin-related protein [Hespellia stercorisuis]|uniref:Cna protein B-type domain-containing protein n=1 Tax=Hespellia stercorisuis DSM 15480 TaxID=1121950 RepID=A0A1M6TBG1_9FIRM|nr:SpaA isopeptide-forming pilin-related protein [Hespellia stercorisuis]SHK54166.1 Cna protein B-type domain-containing protein [Hespellia stercorisuis DSM 15480]